MSDTMRKMSTLKLPKIPERYELIDAKARKDIDTLKSTTQTQSSDISTLKGKASSHDTSISNLNTETKNMRETLTAKDNQMQGEIIELQDHFTSEVKEISGNPVQFESLVKGSAIDVETVFTPIQSGSGDPYPAGGGKNLFDMNWLLRADGWTENNGIYSGPAGAMHNAFGEGENKFPVEFEANTQYALSFNGYSDALVGFRFFFQYSDGTMDYYFVDKTVDDKYTAVSAAGKTIVALKATYGNGGNVYLHDVQVEKGNATTSFAPYSNIRPISGWDALELNHAGKNLFNYKTATVSQGVFDENGRFTNTLGEAAGTEQYNYGFQEWFNGSTIAHNVIMWESGKTRYVRTITLQNDNPSLCLRIFGLRESAVWMNNTGLPAGTILTLGFDVLSDAPGSQVFDNIQIEFGSAASGFQPYQGETYTVQTGQTVYGGRFDWLTGRLTAEWAFVNLDGNEYWEYTDSGTVDARFGGFVVQDTVATGIDNRKSSHFESVTNASEGNINGNGFIVYSTGYADIMYPSITSLDNWKAYLAAQYAAGTPVQIAYKLAEPFTIQLIPQVIQALQGANTLYGDGDTITVQYDNSVPGALEEHHERLKELEKKFSALDSTAVHRYGIRWDKVKSTCTRLYDAASITTDTTNFCHRGSINSDYDNPFDELYPWKYRRVVNTDLDKYAKYIAGDPSLTSLEHCILHELEDADFVWDSQSIPVDVYTPEFWYKYEIHDDYWDLIVADGPLPGYTYVPESLGGRWFGRYNTDSVPLSISGIPTVNVAIGTLHTQAKTADMTAEDIWTYTADSILQYVEYACLNTQDNVGSGDSGSYRQNSELCTADSTGTTISVPTAVSSSAVVGLQVDLGTSNGGYDVGRSYIISVGSGTLTLADSVTVTTSTYISFHGMINKVGDKVLGNASGYYGTNGKSHAYYRGRVSHAGRWRYVLGVFRETGTNHIWLAPDSDIADAYDALDTSVHSDTGIMLMDATSCATASGGYVNSLREFPGLPFFPVAGTVGGSSSNPIGDYVYWPAITAGNTVVIAGGDANNGTTAGRSYFYWNVSSGNSYWNCALLPFYKNRMRGGAGDSSPV